MRAYDQIGTNINLLRVRLGNQVDTPQDRARYCAAALTLIDTNLIELVTPPENQEHTAARVQELILILQQLRTRFSRIVERCTDDLINAIGRILSKNGEARLRHTSGLVHQNFEALITALNAYR